MNSKWKQFCDFIQTWDTNDKYKVFTISDGKDTWSVRITCRDSDGGPGDKSEFDYVTADLAFTNFEKIAK